MSGPASSARPRSSTRCSWHRRAWRRWWSSPRPARSRSPLRASSSSTLACSSSPTSRCRASSRSTPPRGLSSAGADRPRRGRSAPGGAVKGAPRRRLTMTNETEMAPLVPAAATAEAADATPARAEEHRSPGRRVQQFLHVYPTTIPFLVLLLGVIGFAFIAGGRFFHPLNPSLILQQVTIIAMGGIPQTLVILTAGLDLSAGAMMVLSSVGMGRPAVLSGVPGPLAFAARILTGAARGLAHRLEGPRLRLPAVYRPLGPLGR